MGDEVLKKISIFLLSFACLYAQNATPTNGTNSEYRMLDQLFDSINKKRHGLTSEKISATKDPFKINETSQKVTKKLDNNDSMVQVYVLRGILNNKANINGLWFSIGSKVNEYKLKQINSDSVLLDSVGNKLKLMLEKGNENVIIKTH